MTTFRSGGWALPERRARAAAGAVAQSVPPAMATPAAPVLRRNASLVKASLSAMANPPYPREREGGEPHVLSHGDPTTGRRSESIEVVRVEAGVVDVLAGVDTAQVLAER